ncbi:uncharacterized protein LOC115796879 [Archocentrus centrarchus]|uniref:uncharacterized protein LOC115796879 n=1 Tax=Archocentrus centrarchus TaxID=63155 RepID=UPI0011E9EF25|nr:uncharacterized protein LOC115796879 [Archocentrus centrarchus]XP_030609212.1 uncharacterized protein LOC115796879 [Archocentrus centrarchus]
MLEEIDEPVLQTVNSRKRRHQPENAARTEAEENQYSGSRCVPSIACSHNSPVCVAASLTETDLAHIKEQLYRTSDKVKQDSILLTFMDAAPYKQKRPQVEEEEKRQQQREVSIKYAVYKEDKTRVPVCQASFLSIFCIKKDRVHGVAKYLLENDKVHLENRGGSRESGAMAAKKEKVRLHIQSFACRASHYIRRGDPGRKFLPSDLNVAVMHRMFLEQNHEQLSYALYRSIFVHDFNLAFGHPAKDVCSSCVKYRVAVKDTELSAEEKRNKILQYTVHRRQARQLYQLLNDVGESFTVCFDIMENLVLPESGVGQTYSSKQLYFCVFGVVRHRGTEHPLSRHDINLYTWLECENSKDRNIITSALQHYFATVARVDLCQCQSLRLFSDSCYVQNEDINVLSMLFALRSQLFPQLSITYFFPVRGHSFLPANRVLGRIEQDIQKHPSILLLDDYTKILQRHGTVHQHGKDWQSYDFTKEAASFTTTQRTFKLSDARVLQISGDTLGFKALFTDEFCQHSVLKQGKRWSQFKLAPLRDVNCIKEEKKTEQQTCSQERNSNLDQEDPEPPQIKEEQEEVCSSQEGEQFVLKQEAEGIWTDEEQLRLLKTIWKPEIKSDRIDLQQQHTCKKEEVLTDEQVCNQDRNSNLDQEDLEPPQIKEEQGDFDPPQIKVEQEELCSSQEGEHFGLKQEADAFMVTTYEEGDHSEPEPNSEYVASGSNINAELKNMTHHRKRSHSQRAENTPVSESQSQTGTRNKSIQCDTCGKRFRWRIQLKKHMRIHAG